MKNTQNPDTKPKTNGGGASILEYKTNIEKAAELFVGGALPQSDFGEWKDFSHNKKNYSIKRIDQDSLLIKAWGGPNAGIAHHYVRHRPGGTQKKPPAPQIPQSFITDSGAIQAAFSRFRKAPRSHPYLKAKGISESFDSIDFRTDARGNLITPFYSIKSGQISGWQVTAYKPYKQGKFRKWTREGSSTSGIYIKVGPDKAEHIFVAEGVATACTIFEHALDAVVYVSFGSNNLDAVAEKLLREHPNKMIFQVLDRDKDGVFQTKIKSDRLRQLVPDSLGDFNDHRGVKKEMDKLKSLSPVYGPPKIDSPKGEQKQPPVALVPNFLEKTKYQKIEYLDENKMLIRGRLHLLGGEKASLKTTGVFSYLIQQKIRFFYFSDFESEDEDVKTFIRGARKSLERENKDEKQAATFPLDQLDRPDFETEFVKHVQKHDIRLVWEDPPDESGFGNQAQARQSLTRRAYLAKVANVTWLFSRNFSKSEYKEFLSKISGYALFRNVPRGILMTHPIEPGSEIYAKHTKDMPNPATMSLLHGWVYNLGPKPEKSILMRMNIDPNIGPVIYSKPVDRPSNPVKWGKATTQAEKDQAATNKYKVLSYLSDKKGGLTTKELADWMLKMPEFPYERKAFRFLKESSDKGLISGYGDKKRGKIKITTEGKKELDR